MRNGFLFFLCIVLSLSCGSARATTWYVDQAGVNGVTTIQEAVDAAASGDTIRVGPGFYDDIHYLPPPWEEDVAVVQVRQEELTIIGAGPEETIIGQHIDWEPTQGDLRGIVGGRENGSNERLNIQAVGIEGLLQGVLVQGGGVLNVQNCRFRRLHSSIMLYAPSVQAGDSAFVENCDFEAWESYLANQHVWTYLWNYLSVKTSTFSMPEIAIWHIPFHGKSIHMEDCQLNNGNLGVSLVCEEASFKNILFNSQEVSIQAQHGLVTVENCQINDTRVALVDYEYDGGVRWGVSGLTVSNVSEATLRYRFLSGGYIRNSILAAGDKYVVKHYFDKKSERTDYYAFDMTDNWWGTTDPDSIQALIYDGNDDPDVRNLIDYSPFKSEPLVGVKRSSLSGFKALFR